MTVRASRYPHLVVAVASFGIIGATALMWGHAQSPVVSLAAASGTLAGPAVRLGDSSAASGAAVKFGAGSGACQVNAILVNSCRPWLGARENMSTHTITGFRNLTEDHESRIGRQLDWVHDYLDPGKNLSADDKYFITRPNTTLLLNWKPDYDWAKASGGDAGVNAYIDSMADQLKAMAPHKVVLIVFHEPENDETDTSCTSKGSSGTAADYVAMWHNVRARFDDQGVSNVVWGMNYMLYQGGTCMVKALWPGNSYVDWVFADPYIGNGTDYTTRMDFTYDWLRDNSDAAHNFMSKPWGFAEWGVHKTTQTTVYQDYDEAKADLDSDRYPNLKALVVFDSDNPPGNSRVGYDNANAADPTEFAHYRTYADDPRFTDAFYVGK